MVVSASKKEGGVCIFVPEESGYREKVLAYLSRCIGRKVTMNAISEELGLSYGYVHATIYKLYSEGIVKMEQVGNYKLLSVDLSNMLAVAELVRVHVKMAREVLGTSAKLKKLEVLTNDLGKRKDILSIVLFGSQARLEARKTSDIDLLIIISERRTAAVQDIKSEVRTFEVREFLKIQPFIVDFTMFGRMLQSREELNVGKEALKDGIILHGYENYWKMVGEALGQE